MYKKMSIILLPLILILVLNSCSSDKTKISLVDYDKDKIISVKEFEQVYSKNNGGYEKASVDSIHKKKNFLELYTNFKLKIQDALDRQLDKRPEVLEEIEDYKNKIGVTYLLEKDLVEPNLKVLYEKRKEEIRVSHIMFRPDSTGFENAERKALACLDSLKLGISFEQLAKNNSQDFYSGPMGGDIYYITAGDIIPSFEEKCYKLQPGQVYPEPVKTQYGYHLIKATARQPRKSEVKASHILIEVREGTTPEDSVKFLDTVKMIQEKIKQGIDFAELAKEFSKDPGSAPNGGDLGYFARRMMVQPFDEAAFNLKVGEISPIVKTQFGYHLIKVTDIRWQKPYEEERENLKGIYQRVKYNSDQKELIDSLKVKYNFTVDPNITELVANNFDSTFIGTTYSTGTMKQKLGDKVAVSYNNKKITFDSLISWAESSPDFQNRQITKNIFEQILTKFTENKLLEAEANKLDKRYPEFASLMDDYKNGILIFKLQEDEVWNKVKLDSLKLVEFYNANKDKYKWADRVEYSEIHVKNDSVLALVKKYLTDGLYDTIRTKVEVPKKDKSKKSKSSKKSVEITEKIELKKLELSDRALFDTLAFLFTERPGYKEKRGYHGIRLTSDNQLSLKAFSTKEKSYSEPVSIDGGLSLVYCIKKLPAGLKTFDEAFAEVSGGLQDAESKRLEKEYIDSLKAKYKPVFHFERLEKAFSDK